MGKKKTVKVPREKKALHRIQSKWLVLFVLLLAIVGLLTTLFWPHVHKTVFQTTTKKTAPISLSVDAKSALVVDLNTGQIIGEKNANKQVAIASQSKMLVAYGVLKAIEQKKITWESQVTIPANADLSSQNTSLYSHLNIKTGDKVPVRDLYTAMFEKSANDAAFALVTYLSGDSSKDQETLEKWAK